MHYQLAAVVTLLAVGGTLSQVLGAVEDASVRAEVHRRGLGDDESGSPSYGNHHPAKNPGEEAKEPLLSNDGASSKSSFSRGNYDQGSSKSSFSQAQQQTPGQGWPQVRWTKSKQQIIEQNRAKHVALNELHLPLSSLRLEDDGYVPLKSKTSPREPENGAAQRKLYIGSQRERTQGQAASSDVKQLRLADLICDDFQQPRCQRRRDASSRKGNAAARKLSTISPGTRHEAGHHYGATNNEPKQLRQKRSQKTKRPRKRQQSGAQYALVTPKAMFAGRLRRAQMNADEIEALDGLKHGHILKHPLYRSGHVFLDRAYSEPSLTLRREGSDPSDPEMNHPSLKRSRSGELFRASKFTEKMPLPIPEGMHGLAKPFLETTALQHRLYNDMMVRGGEHAVTSRQFFNTVKRVYEELPRNPSRKTAKNFHASLGGDPDYTFALDDTHDKFMWRHMLGDIMEQTHKPLLGPSGLKRLLLASFQGDRRPSFGAFGDWLHNLRPRTTRRMPSPTYAPTPHESSSFDDERSNSPAPGSLSTMPSISHSGSQRLPPSLAPSGPSGSIRLSPSLAPSGSWWLSPSLAPSGSQRLSPSLVPSGSQRLSPSLAPSGSARLSPTPSPPTSFTLPQSPTLRRSPSLRLDSSD